MLVVEDQPVTAGEPIAELVKDDAKLTHDGALADLELRQAELDEVKAALAAAETRFKQPVHLEAALAEAEASLAKIETQSNNLPIETRRAEADYEATQQVYDSKRAAKGVVAAVEIEIAKSKAASAEALVEELRDRSESLYRPNMLQVRVDVRFEDIPKVSLDQPVEINNPALPAPMTGKILFISSEADIQKNTLQVKVEIADPPPVFKPEMLVDVTFLAPQQFERASEPSQELKLYVLQQLIHQDDGGTFVWLADQSEGIARKTMVQTGTVGSNGLVEITSGLTISSRIISGGSDGLRDGGRIKVTSEDSSLGTTSAVRQSGAPSTMSRLPMGDNK